MASALSVEASVSTGARATGLAIWPSPWRNWLTAVWQQLVYLRNAPVRSETANYQAVLTDSVILMNGNITVTLPTAAEAKGKIITCKAINAGGGTRTVSGNGANIDGAATWTTTVQYTAQRFASNGAQWWTV
jgi:hypothetical protein